MLCAIYTFINRPIRSNININIDILLSLLPIGLITIITSISLVNAEFHPQYRGAHYSDGFWTFALHLWLAVLSTICAVSQYIPLFRFPTSSGISRLSLLLKIPVFGLLACVVLSRTWPIYLGRLHFSPKYEGWFWNWFFWKGSVAIGYMVIAVGDAMLLATISYATWRDQKIKK